MQKKQLTKIKDFYSHEMIRNRTEKNFTQQDMADILDCSKRTLQRLENPTDLECTFSSAIQNFSRWASVSNYSLKDWFIKVCCPDEDLNFRAAFKWEKDLISTIAHTDPHVRRAFTKYFDQTTRSPSETADFNLRVNLVILIATYLLAKEPAKLSSLLLSIHFDSDEKSQEQFRNMTKKYLSEAFQKL